MFDPQYLFFSDGRTVGHTDGRTDGRSDGRTDGRTVGRTDGRTYGPTDGRFTDRSLTVHERFTYGSLMAHYWLTIVH